MNYRRTHRSVLFLAAGCALFLGAALAAQLKAPAPAPAPFDAAAELVQGIAGSFSGMGAPTRTAIDQLNDLKAFAEPLLAKMKAIQENDVPALNKALAEAGIPYIR